MAADFFQAELSAQIDRALTQGRVHLEINAGELHRAVGGYPAKAGTADRMGRCCNVMREELRRGHAEVIHEQAAGGPPAYTVRYDLPRPPHA
ncbi:MAG TPA: hypothetical protein VL460_05815 [Caulobacteraceae bacterium]|nr:hypothetical protein [Caulobacteraceae bacterium]